MQMNFLSYYNREMAVATLRTASIGDQLLIFTRHGTTLHTVKRRSEALASSMVTLTLTNVVTGAVSNMTFNQQDRELPKNVLGVFLSK